MIIFQRAYISSKSMHMPKCMCQSLQVNDCLTGLAVHSPSACEWPFQSLAKSHFITNLKKEKMMLNRLVQIQVNNLRKPSSQAWPTPRAEHRAPALAAPRQGCISHTHGATIDLPHAHNRLHCPKNAPSPPSR